jgi:hypothetical protein
MSMTKVLLLGLLLAIGTAGTCTFAATPTTATATEEPPTVLVTGANRGLGYVWAKKYA